MYRPTTQERVCASVSVGFEAIEGVVNGYARRHDEGWSYGNVHDDQDQPLNWWVE